GAEVAPDRLVFRDQLARVLVRFDRLREVALLLVQGTQGRPCIRMPRVDRDSLLQRGNRLVDLAFHLVGQPGLVVGVGGLVGEGRPGAAKGYGEDEASERAHESSWA